MSTEADIGRAVLERLARANAERQSAAEPLRRQIEAILAEHPDWPAKRVQWELPAQSVKLRRVQQVMQEIKRKAVGVSREGALECLHGGT
jgi:hypothetical protein